MRKFYTNSILFLCFGLLSNISSFAQINAVDDTFSVVYGPNQVVVGDFLLNDTLSGSLAQASNVSITMVSTSNPGISISGTNIVVAGGTPQGTYTLVYRICAIASPTTCDTATVTINTQLLANPDNLQVSPCGYNAGNILEAQKGKFKVKLIKEDNKWRVLEVESFDPITLLGQNAA